jgi:amino acid transporter
MSVGHRLTYQLSCLPNIRRTIPLGSHPLSSQARSRTSLRKQRVMTDKQWISWVCGWFAVSGWIALVATAGSLAGSLITGAISLTHENYEVERWHIFLIYLAYMLGACFINIFGLRLLPTIDRAAIFWYVSLLSGPDGAKWIGR